MGGLNIAPNGPPVGQDGRLDTKAYFRQNGTVSGLEVDVSCGFGKCRDFWEGLEKRRRGSEKETDLVTGVECL